VSENCSLQVLDTIATTLLFIVLIGWVWLSIYVGATSVMLSDSGAPGIALVGAVLAVVGTPLSVVIVYVLAVIRAWYADGYTFYYPLVAFVVGTVSAALVMGVALGIVRLGLRLHGTDPGSSAETEVRRVAEPIETAATSAPLTVYTFETTHEYRDGNLFVELGMEQGTGRRYLRTPMPKRNGEREEHYGVDLQEYETFIADPAEAHRFADECRREEHLDRWMPCPASPAYERITFGRKRLAGRRATLLTDRPTDSSGVPVEGIPVGTAFVRTVGNSVDPDGNAQVRLLGVEDVVVSIDSGQLRLP
jgi:hypothetical protein